MISSDSVIVAVRDQVSTDLGGGTAILHLKSGLYYSLNEVGARVWELIQESRTVEDVLAMLLDEYDVPREECERHLLAVLQQLREEELIRVSNGSLS